MRKYFQVIFNSLQEYFVYRLNFILWRVRVIISILITFFLWQTVFLSKSEVFNYQKEQMFTYILLLTVLNGIVLSSQTFRVAEEINYGKLSNFLLKPFSYFGYIFSRDISDKIINTFFSGIELFFLIKFLNPPIFLQTSFFWLSLFFLFSLFSAFLFFEIGMILSFIGFWSREVWAPRFIFFILVTFLAGTYFPLDILPFPLYQILELLPFSYLIFFPLKIYLGTNFTFLIKGFLLMLFWIIFFLFLLRFLWRQGLKVYTAEGI